MKVSEEEALCRVQRDGGGSESSRRLWVRGMVGSSFRCPLLPALQGSGGCRRGRDTECPRTGQQMIRVVGGAGGERIHKEKKV